MKRVIVVGRDAALWLSAATIARALGTAGVTAGVTVEAVELPSLLDDATCHASLPPLEALHAKLGIDEATLLGATGGALSLGHNFADAGGHVPAFFHAWSAYGTPVDGDAFLQHWLKARRFGLNAALQDFCPAAVAAKHGLVMIPDDETDMFGRIDYAYHLPARAYSALLGKTALRLGVKAHSAARIGVERDDLGDIAAVMIDGGRRVAGDLFVDASGSEAVLIETVLGIGCESWRAMFPVDRVVRARGSIHAAIPAYAEQRAWAGGWARLQPDRSGTGVIQAYASAQTTDEVALDGAVAATGLTLRDAVVTVSNPGRRDRAWAANCVAIGEAAAAFDPVHGVDLHAVQIGIVHLLALLPAHRAAMAAARAEYNRLMRSLFERIRDFQAATYLLSPWEGRFWDVARDGRGSAELTHLIATFRARGDIAVMEDETFRPDSWKALLIGLGVEPVSWSPTIDRVPPDRVKAEFRRMLAFIADKVRQQPSHAAYLEQFGWGIAA